MSKIKAVELFMALGLSAVVVSCGPSNTDQVNTQSPAATSSVSEGGEGGEGGTAKNTDADVSYMVSLGLMKGHMIVAKELMDQGKPKEAEPHIGHPVEELYGDIEAELPKRNVKDFKGTLNELHDLVKSKPKDAKVVKLYDQAIQNIDGAILALPTQKRESPSFVLQVINNILTTASEEYTAAIANNKFVELVEYQDSRGFVLYSTKLYQSVSKQLDKQKPEASKAVQDQLKALAKAWPAVNPPKAPILTPDDVSGLVGKVAVASKL
jgi:hypothetical protein